MRVECFLGIHRPRQGIVIGLRKKFKIRAGFGDFERGVKPSGFLATSTYQSPQAIYQEGSDVRRVPAPKMGQELVPVIDSIVRVGTRLIEGRSSRRS